MNFLASAADRRDNIASFEKHDTQTETQTHFIRTPLAVPPSCIADTCTESRFWRGQQKRDTVVFRPGFANFISSSCDHETAIAITATLGSLSIGYITKCCSWRGIFATIAALAFYFRAFLRFFPSLSNLTLSFWWVFIWGIKWIGGYIISYFGVNFMYVYVKNLN